VVQRLIDKQSGPVMTKEELEQATEEYEKNQWLLAGLSIFLGIGTFVVGLKLFGHWGYAVVALALGPVLVAYYFLYKANLPSTPTPSLPPS
jgi:ABC-type transport system involved in cytochrome bd biosynthesis fused ATPase/permease subunit